MGWASGNRWYRQKITISGTKVAGDVTDFPVAIQIPVGNDIFSEANTNGHDIIFTTDDGETVLAFERSVWNKSGSDGVFYVKTDLTTGVDVDIYVYYGGVNDNDQSDVNNTWASHYRGVYHFEETSGSLLDSSGNSRDSDSETGITRNQSGILGGKSWLFNGSDVVQINTAKGLVITGNATRTITTYIYPTVNEGSQPTWASVINLGDGSSLRGWMLSVDNGGECTPSNSIGIHYWGNNTCTGDRLSTIGINQWHQYAGTHNGSNQQRVYLDGNFEGSSSYTLNTNDGNGYIGRRPATGNTFIGRIAEIRVSGSDLGDAWIETEYNNLLDQLNFLSFATREVSPYLITTSPYDFPTAVEIGEFEAIGGVRQILTEYTEGVTSTIYYDMPVYYALADVVSGTRDIQGEVFISTTGTLSPASFKTDVEFFTSSSGFLFSGEKNIYDDFVVGLVSGDYSKKDVYVQFIQGAITTPFGYGLDVDVNFIQGALNDASFNEDIEFTVSTSQLYEYDVDIYSSTYSGIYNVDHWELDDYVDSEMATLNSGTGEGGYLWPFPSDVYSTASGSRHPMEIDLYVSLCNTVPSGQVFKSPEVWPVASGYYFGGEITTSGTLTGYEQDVYVSLESLISGSNQNTYLTDMRLHALEVDNFFLEVDEYTTSAGIMSVDIYDKRRIPVSTANSYFVVSGTQVPVTFSGIEVQTTDLGQPIVASGYRMFFDSPTDFFADEPVEIVAHGANIIGDVIEQTYYLLYGYNLIYDTPPEVVWGWGDQIIVWATAKNKASCPARSTDAWWFEIRPKEHADLGATIVPTGYANLPATIYPQLQPNTFFYGANVKVIVRAKDEAGNEMEPFVLNFTIEDNPN